MNTGAVGGRLPRDVLSRVARRTAREELNPIAMRRAQLAAAGIELTDLTDSNPTRHGLFDPRIMEVMARHLERAGRYEPTARGPWPARAALAERYGGEPDDYWLTASTSEAYGWLFSVVGDPGDAVATVTPGYPLIEPLARWHSLSVRSYRTFYVHPSGWELDQAHLGEVLADEKVRAVIAVNPNNPTGAYAEAAVAGQAAARGLPLIADEVFFPFEINPGQVNAAAESNMAVAPEVDDGWLTSDQLGGGQSGPGQSNAGARRAQRLAGNESCLTFALDGLSKLLAAPQLKLGWIRLSGPYSAKRQAAAALDEIADSYLSVNSAVALALPDLLTLADDSVALINRRLRGNLAIAQRVFPMLRIRTVYGGWMLLLDVPAMVDADDLGVALMDRAGIYVHPGYFYDLPDSTLALSLLPEPAQFEESCQRLLAALIVIASDLGLTW